MLERTRISEIYQSDETFYSQMEKKYENYSGDCTRIFRDLVSAARTYNATTPDQLYGFLSTPIIRNIAKLIGEKPKTSLVDRIFTGFRQATIGLTPAIDDGVRGLLQDVIDYAVTGQTHNESKPQIKFGEPKPQPDVEVAWVEGYEDQQPSSEDIGRDAESMLRSTVELVLEIAKGITELRADTTLDAQTTAIGRLVESLDELIKPLLARLAEPEIRDLKESIELVKANAERFRTNQYGVISVDEDRELHNQVTNRLGQIIASIDREIDARQPRADLTGRIKIG